MSSPLRVLISSTAQDLGAYRKAAAEVITSFEWVPKMMENFQAQPGYTVDAVRKVVEECDVVLLIVAWRQGWVPTVEQGGNGHDSITALERQHALSKDKPVLTLLAHSSWPGDRYEDDPEKRQWVKKFREELNQVAAFFFAEEDEQLPRFRDLVQKTLLAHKQRLLESQEKHSSRRGDGAAPQVDFLSGAQKGLLEARGIPVLGSGIYEDGPLSCGALAEALLNSGSSRLDRPPKDRVSLATAAEYRERVDVMREQFLESFRKILVQQTKDAPMPGVIELLAQLDKPRLIVSMTYDYVLEEQLEKSGRKYAVVSHIRESSEPADGMGGVDDDGAQRDAPVPGKIVVQRPGKRAQFCRADLLRFDTDEYIVYKPLGSPFLNHALEAELGIDTVVVTETDHAGLLQRLESPETGVPSAVKARFNRQALLFLGYAMDIWHFRLAALLFRAAARDTSRTPTLAVRVPGDSIEEVAWNRINAQLIRMDPAQFARSASAAAAAA